ncbi:metabotropic glutamate receptor 6-like [Centruroides vittatus]|uniref:metabotropic glutamate receptor 6-like n=1 Tax=Centruroides vittatus TaxID=120091 RepID=UPI00350FA46B
MNISTYQSIHLFIFICGLVNCMVTKWTQSKHNLNISWPIKRVAEIEGDIVLGGLMMVHEREDLLTCGPIMPQGGIQALECMLYTIDWINSQKDFLPNITLGAYVLDDCDKDTYGLEQAVDFIKGYISNLDEGTYRCPDGSSPSIRQKIVSGVLGAASSVTSIQVANLLRLFKIPQVSFFSTSPELSNKQRFEYFLRTVPSDKNQAHAMVEIVKRLKWAYISILYEESNYGVKAFSVLEELLAESNICIAIKERLIKDSGVAVEEAYDNIVQRLLSKQSARGVIIFGSDQEVAGVMRAIRRNNATGIFSWIGSDGWSARALVFEGNEDQVEGTLSVQPRAHPVKGFDEYFLSRTVYNNRRNPWFIEYWEHYFNCRWPNSTDTPFNGNYTRFCTGEEKMKFENGYEPEGQLQFVSDAVLTFAYALKQMHQELCQGKSGLCQRMKPINGTILLEYLKVVSFTGMSGDKFRFSPSGDGPARYNIIHFKQISPGNYKWIQVGEYKDGELELNLSQIRFRMDNPNVPISVCSLPCRKGQAKKFLEGESCCWHCFNCTRYQFLKTETLCEDCSPGFIPDADQASCLLIPESHMTPGSALALGAMTFSTLGVILTGFFTSVFLKHNDTPIIRASGRELSYVLLFGILMCYIMTFILVQKPSNIICGVQKTGIGLCFAIVYSAILTKTNRISRIFNAGKKTVSKPAFISPQSQLIICGALVSVQISITAVWLVFTPPRAIHSYPTREENLLVCTASMNATYMVAFAYPIFLIIVCTIYAILTRKIPESFNESKYIGLTMYTTCIIWLAFVPIYFTTSSNVEVNITSMCLTISLSATVTLVCLFTPKIYNVIWHPERNVRMSIMKQKQKCMNSLAASEASSQLNDVKQEKSVQIYDMCTKLERADCGTQTFTTLLNNGNDVNKCQNEINL